jgi:hypothetical protein
MNYKKIKCGNKSGVLVNGNFNTTRDVLNAIDKAKAVLRTPKPSKYHNKRVQYDGRWFDSKKECDVYKKFALALKGGSIKALECQKRYEIIVEGMPVCTYVADFVVTWPDGKVEVFDAKGFKTKEYLLKRKLMKAVYDINIVEV